MKLSKGIIYFLLICSLQACKSSATNDSASECVEKPKANCMCTRQYDPVCGCNNKTYGNACEAECAGITDYKKGECGGQ